MLAYIHQHHGSVMGDDQPVNIFTVTTDPPVERCGQFATNTEQLREGHFFGVRSGVGAAQK